MKAKMIYATSAAATVVLGLGSRRFPDELPSYVTVHAGDALWAGMVYFGCRFLFVKKSLRFAAAAALLFSFLIEFSQLYQADWINRIRATLLGSLILGHGFLTADLLRYTIGVAIAYSVDRFLLKART